jgi:hypothetical protein
MMPLLFLLRNARDLHPHAKTPTPTRRTEPSLVEEPEPELVGAGTFD